VSNLPINGEQAFKPLFGSVDDIPKRKVWRVRLLVKELTDAGFDPQVVGKGWPVIEGLLRAKGLPKYYLDDRTPFRMDVDESTGDITLEFD
jgi:hypothetical protein